MRDRERIAEGPGIFSRQGQLFTGGPSEGFLQGIDPAVRLGALVLLVGAAAICYNPVLLALGIGAVLVVALLSYLDVPSILRATALPVALLALPSWAAAVFLFDAPVSAAAAGILRVTCCVAVSVILLHSIGLANVGPVLRRAGLPEELCLAWRMMISQAASFSELSIEMQFARAARTVRPAPGWLTRRHTGSQAAILLARMLQRSGDMSKATAAREIPPAGDKPAAGAAAELNLSDATPAAATASPSLLPETGRGLPPDSDRPLFRMSGLTHEFTPGAAALKGVSSEIHPGGCTALLGANGAGKSTLLHLLAGLITPTQGQVLWRGEAVSAQNLKSNAALRARFRRSIGIVFPDPDCQWLCNTVQEEVELGPRQIWSRDEARERAAQVMVLLGVNHLADRPPYALSGGQKRRVALASVIVMDPDVLLLDEPTLSLDAATTDFLLEWLTEFLSDAGKTLVLATHDLALVRELAHSAIVITPCHRLGRSGTAAEVLADVEFLQRMNLASRRRRRFCID